MSELKLKRYELPKEIRKFTKKEEAELFPKPGTTVLAYIDGDLTLLTFDWYYQSFKQGPDGEFVRDGNGEIYFSSSEDDYIISKHNVRPFEEYWVVLE